MKALSSLTLDEIYPQIFGQMLKAVYDPNPYVKRAALIGILKVKLASITYNS